MNEQLYISKSWWQRPQPVWVSTLLSTLTLLALFGLWNTILSGTAFEGDTSDIETVNTAAEQGSGLIPYQGFVSSSNGQPLTGNSNFVFKLYNVTSGGTALWTETHNNVPVQQGMFQVVLGSKTNGGIADNLWQSALYLETAINGETLTPRELVKLGTAYTAFSVPDGSITNSKISLQHSVFSISVPDLFPLSGEYQDLGQITMQFDSNSTAIFILNIEISGTSLGSRSVVRLYDGNNQVLCGLQHTSTNVLTTSRTCIANVSAGSHTFTLEGRHVSGSQAPLVRGGSNVIIIPLAQAP